MCSLAAKARLNLRATDQRPSITPRVLELFEQSPLGVLRALDATRLAREPEPPHRELVLVALRERLLLELPPEFPDFLGLSRAERTDAILRIPTTLSHV